MPTKITQTAMRIAAIFVAGLLLSVCWARPAHADALPVAIVLSDTGGAYHDFSHALREELLRRNIPTVVIERPDAPLPDASLVIGVGMRAAGAVAASNAPAVLNVLVPKSGYEKLLHDFPQRARSKSYSAIYLDQPIPRQLNLIAAALPAKQDIGVLYSAPPTDLALLRRETGERKLRLHEQAAGAKQPLAEALQNVLKESDVLLALPDTEIYNSATIRNILLATYRDKIPLIGFSPGYVKAGALCALYSTPAQLAAQAAVLTKKFIDTQALPAAQYPREFEVSVNEQVARSLGLRIRSAAALRDEIHGLEGKEP